MVALYTPIHIPNKLHCWPIQFSWLHGWLIMKLIWTEGMGHVLTAPTLILTERWWLMSLFTNMEEPSSDLIEASYVLETISAQHVKLLSNPNGMLTWQESHPVISLLIPAKWLLVQYDHPHTNPIIYHIMLPTINGQTAALVPSGG